MDTGSYRRRLALPLEAKVAWSQGRIIEWYRHWGGAVYVAYSGGKDSTVLLDLVRGMFPRVPAMFVNTGLEYPEIVRFAKRTEDLVVLRPHMRFKEVIERYGYPVVSKEQAGYIYQVRHTKSEKIRQKRLYGRPGSRLGMISKKWQYLIDAPFPISDKCCWVMKKKPAEKYAKESDRKAIIGVKAEDSRLRRQRYLAQGCNFIGTRNIRSHPLSIWTDEDIWEYIRSRELPYCEIYDMGYETTGCVFCMFGLHMQKPLNAIQLLQKTHPRLWEYGMEKLGLREVMEYINVPYEYEADLFEEVGVCQNVAGR